jgi:hypothetical protein
MFEIRDDGSISNRMRWKDMAEEYVIKLQLNHKPESRRARGKPNGGWKEGFESGSGIRFLISIEVKNSLRASGTLTSNDHNDHHEIRS